MSKVFVKDRKAWPALSVVDLQVSDGEFLSLLGPSGCGKTTVMNILAGLLEPTSGTIRYGDVQVGGRNSNVGYMTQKDSLLPWRNVRRNVSLALEVRGFPKSEIGDRVRRFIEIVGLTGFENHYPHQLSGGMRKRALLARTLVYEPKILLMDEPFGNLDAQLKLVLQGELMRLWSETAATMVFITHDIEEAVLLSDRIVIFGARPGRVKSELTVDLGRPRDAMHAKFSPRFSEIYDAAWADLRDEYLRGEDI